MANKLTTVIDAIQAQLETLSSLKAVQRGLINPVTEKNLPVVALAAHRLRRRDGVWECDLLIQAMPTRDSTIDPDEATADLVAELQDKIEALIDAGTAGGYIAEPVWDCWYTPGSGKFPLRPVGAVGMTTIAIDGALKT